MLVLVLRAVGSLVLIAWGIAHIAPVRGVTRGFGGLAPQNRRIVVSAWIAEGLALVFVGAVMGLVACFGIAGGRIESLLALASAGFLLVLDVVDVATKARNAVLPMRLCPAILAAVACLDIVSACVRG